MNKKINKNLLIKYFIISLLIKNMIDFHYFIFKENNIIGNEQSLKIFIMTHKDFKNYRYNPIYSIVADDNSELKNKYNLDIIYANRGKLFNMSRAYSEMSKLYYIYELYKNGTYSSRYVGLNHYRRYFKFTDIIPNLKDIFKNYDVILNKAYIIKGNMKEQFCKLHDCKKYDEIIDIIKDIRPEYYETALKTSNKKKVYFCNLFIMKKEDFLKYCEFMYDILFEFDKRNGYKSDGDLLKYSKTLYKNEDMQLYQSRLQAFLSERISNIFYYHHFKRIKTFDYGDYRYLDNKRDKIAEPKNINDIKDYNDKIKYIFINFFINNILLFVFLLILSFTNFISKNIFFNEKK